MGQTKMTRRFTALLMSTVCGGFSMPASAGVVLFKGMLGLYAANPGCNILPYIEQGGLFKATYLPAGVGDNGPSTVLMLMPTAVTLNDLFVSSYTMTNGSVSGVFKQVAASQTVSNGRLVLSFRQYSAQMRMLQQSPTSLDGAKFIDMKLQIRGFGGVATCTVSLHGFVGVGDSLTAG